MPRHDRRDFADGTAVEAVPWPVLYRELRRVRRWAVFAVYLSGISIGITAALLVIHAQW